MYGKKYQEHKRMYNSDNVGNAKNKIRTDKKLKLSKRCFSSEVHLEDNTPSTITTNNGDLTSQTFLRSYAPDYCSYSPIHPFFPVFQGLLTDDTRSPQRKKFGQWKKKEKEPTKLRIKQYKKCSYKIDSPDTDSRDIPAK